MKVRNKSETAQTFTNIPTFEAGETREVSEVEGEFLLRSPHMEEVKQHRSTKGTSKDNSFKAVDPD